MNRAYSTLDIKSVDDETRTITGIASTPSTDRMGDIVEPKGAQFTLPIPLLWQHRADSPIGMVTKATVTKSGIEVVAEIAKGVHEDIDRAWALIKAKLVRGLSIGFKDIESDAIPNSWGRRFTKWDWLELSAVTIPANADATILAVKQYEFQDIQEPTEPAATGKTVRVVKLNDPARDRAKPFVIRKVHV